MSKLPIQASRIRILAVANMRQPPPESVRVRFRQMRPCAFEDTLKPLCSTLPQQNDASPHAQQNNDSVQPGQEDFRIMDMPSRMVQQTNFSEAGSDSSAIQHRITSALMHLHRTDTAIDHLARQIADFCQAPSIVAGGSWEIRLAIDPMVLPETSLLLRLFSHQLQLLFESRTPTSVQLLRDRQAELNQKLSVCLREKYDIDIQVWQL